MAHQTLLHEPFPEAADRRMVRRVVGRGEAEEAPPARTVRDLLLQHRVRQTVQMPQQGFPRSRGKCA